MRKVLKEIYCNRFIEITENAIKKTINNIKTFKEDELDKSNIFLESHQILCSFEEGSPEEQKTNYSSRDIYSLSYHSIKELISKYLTSEDNTQEIEELEEIGGYTRNDMTTLNPQVTLFGFTFITILEKMFRTEENNLIRKINEMSFDKKLFDEVISEITDFAVKDEVECTYYYFIYGPLLKGNDSFFDENVQSRIIIPNNTKREELIEFFRFRSGVVYGSGKAWEQIHAIMGCSGWITGKVRLKTPEMDINTEPVIEDLQLPSPRFVQEAFNLLVENIDVHFVSIPNEYNLYSVNIYPGPERISYGISLWGGRSYPRWMESTFFFPRKNQTLVLDENNLFFIQRYPEFRLKQSRNSIEDLIFNRFMDMITTSNSKNVILESCIIFETLLTTETKELGFQLRVKLAILLGMNFQQKRFIQEVVKRIYDIRSDIVHNGGHKAEKLAKKLGGLRLAANLSKKLVKLLLLRMISIEEERFDIISRDNLVTQLDNYMIGERTEINSNIYFEKQQKEFISNMIDEQKLSSIVDKHFNSKNE